MPKYQVEAPDGRTFILEGDSAPTEQELEQIFSQYKEQPVEEPQQQETQSQDPGIVVGSLGNYANQFLMGGGSLVAGAIAPQMKRIGALSYAASNPLSKGAWKAVGESLDPSKEWETMKQGAKQFSTQQKAFEEEHPIASTVSNVAGFTAGMVGGGIRATTGLAKKGVTKAIARTFGEQAVQESKAANAIAKTIADGVGFGVQGFGTTLTEEPGVLQLDKAIKAGAKDSILGLALGMVNGVVTEFSAPLVKTVEKFTGASGGVLSKPIEELATQAFGEGTVGKVAKAIAPSESILEATINAGSAVAEGAVMGAVPSILEGEKVTGKDLLTGVGFAAGGRLAAKGVAKTASGVRKYLTEPTKMQKAEMVARTKGLPEPESSIQEKVTTKDLATGKEKYEVTREEIDALKKQDPYLSDDAAKELIIDRRKASEKLSKTEPEKKLPFMERFHRRVIGITEKVRETFNTVRPFERIEEMAGIKDESLKASNAIYKSQNQGEITAKIQPLADALETESKRSPTSVERAGKLLQAQKEAQWAKNEGRQVSEETQAVLKRGRTLVEDPNAPKDGKGVKAITDEPVDNIVEKTRELNQKTLDTLFESGRIDEATYKKWKENDNYVPSVAKREQINGKEFDTAEQNVYNDIEDRVKKYTGKAEDYENPIFSSVENAKDVQKFADMQKAKKLYLESAMKAGEPVKLVKPNLDYKGGKVGYNSKNEIVVWENGKPQVWEVPETIANFFNPKPYEKPGFFRKSLGAVMNAFKQGTTGLSFGFSLVNPLRDMQSALAGNKYGVHVTTDMVSSSWDSILSKGKNDPLYATFKKEFGGGTFANVEIFKGLSEKSIDRAMNTLKSIQKAQPSKTNRGFLTRLFGQSLTDYSSSEILRGSKLVKNNVPEALSYLGNVGEESTRYTAFKSALQGQARTNAEFEMWMKNPNSIPRSVLAEAGKNAREVTLNFNKKMNPFIEKANKYFVPYLKPSILGAMRGWEVLTNPETAPRAWRTISNLGILQGLINVKAFENDERMKEEYGALNKEIATKNFTISDKKTGKIYMLPLSQEFAPITKAFSLATEAIYNKLNKKEQRDFANEMSAVFTQSAENLVPFVGYLSGSNLSPIAVKPWLEWFSNYNFYSKTPIQGRTQLSKPSSQRYTRNTPKVFVATAQFVSNKFGKELVNPMFLDHMWKSYTSSIGKEAMYASNKVIEALDLGPWRASSEDANNPVLRRFIANNYAPYNQYALNAREIITKTKQFHDYMEQTKGEGLGEKQLEKYEEGQEIYRSIKKYDKKLTEIYKKRTKINNDLIEDSNYIKSEYKSGKINKKEYDEKKSDYISYANEDLDYLNQIERETEIDLIREANETIRMIKENKKSNKK